MKKTIVFLLLIALIVSQDIKAVTKGSPTTQKNIGTCAKYTSDKQSCLECVPHYHLFEGQCYIDIHGCSQYVFGNICRKCQQGFILVNNECCDKHCMAKIFKNYQAASQQSEMTEEQKIERRISEGYEKTIETLSSWKVQFTKFSLHSTSNQVLQGYVRYFIKIMANDKPYRCIADFEVDTKKIFVLQFRLESEMSSIKETILSQQDVVTNDQARVALQYTSGKFGLRTYGASLERVSVTVYKYGSQFKLIYISSQLAMIIHVVVASAGNKKQPPYSPWSEQRKDVQTIKTFVQKSMTVVKMRNVPDLEVIKQTVSQTNQIKPSQVQMKTIEKVKQGVYKYTFVNQQTKQVFEQVSRIDSKTKKVQIIEHKQVINKDIKNMKLPESPEKKIIPKQQATQAPEVKQTIKYLEQVQPSLATKQIVNVAVETIGQNKKITLIQKKNDQTTRVVVLHNQRTNERRLIDESPVISTPPTQTIYTTTMEGKPKIITTDVQKFKKNDEQVGKVISTIEKKLPLINTTNIVSFEKTEGNLVNTYQVVIKGDKIEQPKQQVTVVQNTETKQVKIIDVGQIPTPVIIKPVERKPTTLTQTEYKSTEVKMVIEEFKKTKPQLQGTDVVIKKVDVEQTKFVNQYTVVVQTKTGQTLTVKANKPHEQKKPEIVFVKPVYVKPTQTKKVEQTYVSKVTVDEVTGYKTVTTTKPEQIKASFVTQVLQQVKTTQTQPKVEQIQSIVRKQYENTVTETVVIKEQHKFVQVTVQQNKKTGTVKKVHEQIVDIKVQQSQPILPIIPVTKISETTYTQMVKVSPVLQNVTQTLIVSQPIYKNEIPVTTEVQQSGPIQTITFVYENKATNEKQRVVTEYNEVTQKTVIKQQIVLPKVIEKVVFEKDVTPTGDIKIISNKIEEIKKQDKHITTVVRQIAQKVPMVQNNIVRFEVISNQIANSYQVTAVQPTTKETVTVSVSYNKQTDKITLNDIQEQPKNILIAPKPVEKPVIILTSQQITKPQPQVESVVTFVGKTVDVKQIKQIKQVKNTLTTNYEVIVETPKGSQTVVVVVSNNNKTDVTLIDVKQEKPLIAPAPTTTQTSSYTSVVVDSTNVKDTTTNENKLITSNKYLKIVSESAVSKQPLLKGQAILCFSEDIYKNTVQITYMAKVNSVNVVVSGIVDMTNSNMLWIQTPIIGNDGSLTASTMQSCADRSSTITTVTKDTIISLANTDSEIKSLTAYVSSQFSTDSIDKLVVEKFSSSVKYILLVTIRKVSQRIVLVYIRSTTKYIIIEKPETIQQQKPVVFQQKTDISGTKIITTNSVQQVKIADQKYTTFIQTLTQQVPVQPSQVTNIVSKQNLNTNQYIITVKNEKTTSQIKAIFKKDDQSIIVTEVNQQPQPLITPLVKPKVIVSKQEYETVKIQKVVEQINNNKKIPNITTESIKQILVTKTPVTVNYHVVTETTHGKTQSFIVSENIKGQTTVIDYKPAPTPLIAPAPEVVKTQYTVNKVSGIQTQVTNDVKIIKQSRPVQTVITKLVQQNTVSKNSQVISAVTKTSDKTVQTTIIMRSPEKPEENLVVIAVYDKKTDDVTIVGNKKVQVTDVTETVTVEEEVVETVYSTTVIQKTIKQDKVLQKIVKKVGEVNKQVRDVVPTEIVLQKLNDKIISTVSYEGKKVSTVVYDEKTEEVQQISSQSVPTNIKPLVYETERTTEGTTTITTNSVQKITEVNKNFQNIVSEIKQKIPTILTQKIEGIKIIKSDIVDAPQKIIVLFETEKPNEKAQIAVIDQPNKQKPIIIDVQTILPEEIVPVPQPIRPVKLSTKQIKLQKIETIITQNIKQLPIKEVKAVVEAHVVQTAYSKIMDVEIQDKNNQRYIIKTEQIGNNEPVVIDYVKVPQVKNKQIFTVTTTNTKNGIISTYTNDIKVMSDEKTFTKCVDYLEKQRSLSKLGYTIDSETISRLQRSVEHHIRFVNKQTNEGIDYRVIVDSRTGQISINEQTKITFTSEQSYVMPAEKSFLEIPKSQLPDAMTKYTFIQSSLDVLRKADYTFESKIPDLTQVKQYKSISSQSTSTGYNAVQVIMTFQMVFSGSIKKTRVVFLGQQKTAGKGYIMKIIDITTLPDIIPSVETKVTFDEYNRKTTFTNDVKTLEKNNFEYTKIVDKIQEDIPTLSSAEVSSVMIKEYKNVNEYTVMVKKGTQTIQTKVTYNKVTEQTVISDFKTQSPKSQIERVPIRQIQSIVTQVSKQKLITQEYVVMQQQIIQSQNLPQDTVIKSVQIQQNPKVDTYVIKVVDTQNIQSTVTAFKNPTTSQFTIISYKPAPVQPTQPQVIRTKQSITEIKIDSFTGTQIVKTDDVKVIKETPIISTLTKKIVQDKTVEKKSQITSAVTKTSQNKIQTTVVVHQSSKPKQETVIIAISNKTEPSKVEIISTEVVEITEQIEEEEQIIEEVVITQSVYKTVIKKDTHLQNIVKSVETKIPQTKNVVPTRVVMQTVGQKTVSEVCYETRKITVITNQNQEVIQTYEQQIPRNFTAGIIQQTVTKEGTTKITTSDTVLMQKTEVTFQKVIPQIIKQVSRQDIKTIVSEETSFGKIYTIVSQKPEWTQPQQTTYYYNKQTEKVVSMGTQQIPIINVIHPVIIHEPVIKPVPQTKWETHQVKSVISEVTKTVNQQKITKVEELAPTTNYKFYQVTYDTPKGSEVVKITIDKVTKQTLVIDTQPEKPLIAPAPQPVQPSQTTITVDQNTGIKTTTTTDIKVIQSDKTIQQIKKVVFDKIPTLEQSTIVSKVTIDYNKTVQQRVIFKSESTYTQVVSMVNKDNQQVTIIQSSTVDSSTPVVSDYVISSSTITSVISTDEILKNAIKFVASKYPQFNNIEPMTVNVEDLTKVTRYTFIFKTEGKFRMVVVYDKTLKQYEIVQQPTVIIGLAQPVVFESTTNDQGRTTYFTNDIKTLAETDVNFQTMFSSLTSQVKIKNSEISSITSSETYTGNSYTIITSQGSDKNQINVIYNKDTKQIKIIGMQTVPQPLIAPAPIPRPIAPVPKQSYETDQIQLIISQSITKYNVPKFTTYQILKVGKSKTPYGTNYVFEIDTKQGKATLTTSVTTVVSETSTQYTISVISYNAPVQTTQQPMLISEAPSSTQYSVDTVTGTQVQITNDVKVIKQSTVVKNVVTELTKTSAISKESEVISVITKITPETTYTTMIVKQPTQHRVVVTVTDKNTNQVKLIAEKPVPQQLIAQPQIIKIIPQTIVTSSIYDEVIKKDVHLQTVIKQVTINHPQIKQPKPTKVVVQKVGQKIITEVDYKNITVTVVSDSKTQVTKEVSYSSLPKESERKPVVIEQRVTQQGTRIVTSNKIEHIQKIVPTVRPAIVEVTKIFPIKTEQIKTITSSVEQKTYTVVTVDQNNKVKQIKFSYEPEKTKPIRIIDVQEFSEPVVPTKPKEIVYETVVIQEQPQIIKAIEVINKTNSVVKSNVTEIIKVEKSVTNFVEQYKVQVKTKTQEQATITFEVNPNTQQTTVVDIIKFVPLKEEPKPVIVQQIIDSVTQTRQTTFPTIQTYKQDQTYTQVTQHLKTEIDRGYQIVSVVKQNYGENKQVSILLKSEDKSPQQVQLNINSFNNEVVVLQNKTIVSQSTEDTLILSKDLPKPAELKINPVDEQKFEIISKLSSIKQEDNFKTIQDVKVLEKNDLFKKADTYLKTQFESVLQQSNVVHVSTKQSLDTEEYKVYYVGTQKADKEIYEAKIKLNVITRNFEVQEFNKIDSNTKPQKSNLNIGSDIAYGYQKLEDFSNNKNLDFVVQQAKKHYTTLGNAVIQSVEVLSLCNGRFNYKIYFKNGLQVIKYIVYFEEAFKRVIFLAGKQFSFGGGNYETIGKQEIVNEGYFKNVNQFLKQKNTDIADGSQIILVERQDRGKQYNYRVIYGKEGKTYHASSSIDKDLLNVKTQYFNQIIEVPVVQQQTTTTTTVPSEQYATLRINDLAHNSNFEKVHRQILSKQGSFLQNAQLVGAQQKSDMFKIWYRFYFLIKQDYYKIQAQIDSTNKKVTMVSELQKVNLETGYSVETGSSDSQQIIAWAQKRNPDLISGVIVEVSSKKQIFGRIYKVVFKLQTKYYKIVLYKQGNDLKVLSQTESTSLEQSPTVRPFPRPVILNRE